MGRYAKYTLGRGILSDAYEVSNLSEVLLFESCASNLIFALDKHFGSLHLIYIICLAKTDLVVKKQINKKGL